MYFGGALPQLSVELIALTTLPTMRVTALGVDCPDWV
jgi:hypothetical protein